MGVLGVLECLRGHQHVCPLNCHAQLRFEVEKGFHVKQHSFFSPFRVMETRRSAICVTSVLRCFQSLSQLALHISILSCTCNLTSNAFTLAQDVVPQRKTCCMEAEHASCPRYVQTTHHGSSSGTIASSAGADAARAPVCYRTDQDPHVAGKQQRIGGRSSGNDHSAGYDNSRLSLVPKVNCQFGKDIIPNIFDSKQRNDFREWAENSALHLSAQCVDACEILLE